MERTWGSGSSSNTVSSSGSGGMASGVRSASDFLAKAAVIPPRQGSLSGSMSKSWRKPVEPPEAMQNGNADPKEEADFSFNDAEELCSLFQQEQTMINKKQRWLASLIPKPDGSIIPVKRPRFLKDVYMREWDVRSDEVSSERVKVHVEKCFSFGVHCNLYSHHVVQDGIQLFNLQKAMDGSLCPESLEIMNQTISRLSNEALLSVANISTHNQINFEKIRPKMKKVIEDHLPKYLAELGDEESKSQLFGVLTNPCSYQSDAVSFSTPVSQTLLSSIHKALNGLNEMPLQVLIAMNRKLREKPHPPIFLNKSQYPRRNYLFSMVEKKCGKLISELVEGKYLPKKLAKALSVMNLYQKLKLRCIDISQAEFFPFSRRVMSLQNDVLNALWFLPNANSDELKFLSPILCQGSKVKMFYYKAALEKYLIECLFECDEDNFPNEALKAITFLIRMATKHQQIVLTEERMVEEMEAVLDLSSYLKSLICCFPEGCSSDDEVSLGSEKCSEDNDFILTETNYFKFSSQQQMHEGCCSNSTSNAAETSGSFRGTNCVPEVDGFLTRLPRRIEHSGGAAHCRNSEAACNMKDLHLKKVVGATNEKAMRCSEEALSEICDQTAIVAHKLIGKILQNMLLAENNCKNSEINELTKGYLGAGSVSQRPHVKENQEAEIVIQAIQEVLPNIPESCIDKVRRILDGGQEDRQERMDADCQNWTEVDELNYQMEESLKETEKRTAKKCLKRQNKEQLKKWKRNRR